MRLAVVTAGLRRPSSTRLLADRLTEATVARLDASDVTVVEVRDHAHDLVNHMVSGYPSETLAPALAAVTGAAGLIAVTPTVSASYSGLFKAFFDVLDEDALRDKPVLAAATGGTARHSLVLDHAVRPLFAYLHAEVVPTTVFAAPEDWGGATAPSRLADRIAKAATELADRMKLRGDPPPSDPFAPVPFDTLLPGS
jgi:FMN reductase